MVKRTEETIEQKAREEWDQEAEIRELESLIKEKD